MAGQRSAGYCSNCNRGVTIERPKHSGLMDKMKSALNKTGDDEDWVCSKCGETATRGFTPPPDFVTEEAQEDSSPAQELPPEPENVQTPVQAEQTTPEPDKPNEVPTPQQPAATVESAPVKLEATCHLCNKQIPFDKEAARQQIACPACAAPVVLPAAESDSSLLTSSPKIMKLDDDPERPEISKAVCTECNFELTYPKRLAGKNVDCPSCSESFILP